MEAILQALIELIQTVIYIPAESRMFILIFSSLATVFLAMIVLFCALRILSNLKERSSEKEN